MKFDWIYQESSELEYIQQIKKSRKYPDDFFHNSFDDLPDENLLKDLDKASKRIIEAIRNNERIMIYGHDDPDGITSTYILFDFLKKIGCQSHYYHIPNRLIENHGIQNTFIERVFRKKINLVITVDGGITAVKQVDEMNSKGIDVIITDHHIVQDQIPNALAVVDPKQEDCRYPYDMLAGVGIAYLLINNVARKLLMEAPKSYLLWTAIGTLADRAPMTGVNRILLTEAINNWLDYEDSNLKFIHDYQRFGNDPQSIHNFINFSAKLIANGREDGGNHKGMRFLLGNIQERSKTFFELLNEKNTYEADFTNVVRTLDQILPEKINTHFIYFDHEGKFPITMIGQAASITAMRHKVPTLFITNKADIISCEARCTEGFDLVDSFTYCSEHLKQFGGHVKAAGFTAYPETINHFVEKFEEYITIKEKEILKNKQIFIDIVIEHTELNLKDLEKLNQLQPFGAGNSEPIILFKNVDISKLKSEFYLQNNHNWKQNTSYDIVCLLKNSSTIQLLDYKELK